MGIQLAELSDAELDAFLEDFIQPNDAPQTRETVPESTSGDQFISSVALTSTVARIQRS